MLEKNRVTGPAAVWLLVAVAALLLTSADAGASPAQASAASGVEATWVPREVNFVYVGFTTKYTCQGLQDKVRNILLKLGARDDVKVTSYGCERVAGPEINPGVRIVMNVLQPAGPRTGRSVEARWQMVDVLADRNLVDAALDCELIVQLDRDVLPLFATRHVDYSAACAAHQQFVGGTRLKADVLVPNAAQPGTAAR
jgi:hypothetical protein